MLARSLRWLVLPAIFLIGTPASAQSGEKATAPTPAEKAVAQAKFEEAKKLLARKKYPEACKLLEESLRIEEAMAARFRLAECYERSGKIASAWINYVDVADAASVAKMPDREKVARKRAGALKPRLTQLTIQVPEETKSIEGLEIRRNGTLVSDKLYNQPTPIDAGKYEIRATAPGMLPWTGEVDAEGEGSTAKIRIGTLAPDPAAPKEPPPQSPDPAPPSGKTMLYSGIALTGAGVLGMAGSVIAGVVIRGHYDTSASHCMDNYCDATGLAIRNDARGQGDIATAFFIASAAIGAGGAVLWILAPQSPSAKSAGLSLGPGQLVLKGAW